MEVRIKVDDEFMKDLKKQLGNATATDVTVDALTLLNWAVEEAKAGRVILSAERDGTDVHQLAMPALKQIKPTT
ncbi:MAG TPA: hypothetical protein VJ785_09610 [Anaerolineales bacterium]|nr:hypothetical protein [Anaerolineales bacterium]